MASSNIHNSCFTQWKLKIASTSTYIAVSWDTKKFIGVFILLTAAILLDLLDTKIPRATDYAKTKVQEKVTAGVQCWHLQDIMYKAANGITLPLEKLFPKSTSLSNLMVKGCFFALFFLFCSSAVNKEFGKPVKGCLCSVQVIK